jgi:hypothetical protein
MATTQTTTKEIRQGIKLVIEKYVTPFLSTTTNKGTVYDTAPMGLVRANLPALVITDGATNYTGNETRGIGWLSINTSYNLSLYQGEWQANQDNNINLSDIDDTFYELENLFVIRRSLENADGEELPNVESTFLQSATPIEIKRYAPIASAIPSESQYVHKRMTLNIRYTRKAVQ